NGDYGDFDYNYMIYLVNRERENVGSRPLTYNHKLNKAAQLHSEYQAQVGRMSHSGIYGSSPFERIRNTGYRSSGEAENVAYNQQSVEEVVNTWVNSPGHYRNMVNPEFTEMGAGMADYYWTQTFGCGD
ncbi:SCP-like extracellular, partial [Neoconidiobolus thromboides FSU 785]